MGGIDNYRPVTIPHETIELRVHGVSGTPADILIKDTAVLVSGTETAGFHRHDPVATRAPMAAGAPGFIEAYAWGGLTSGSRITSALRLLLLPFALVNVAGWMLPGVRADDGAPTAPAADAPRGRARLHSATARLVALALTVYATTGAYWLAAVLIERLRALQDAVDAGAVNKPGWLPGWLPPVPDDVAIRAGLSLAVVLIAVGAWSVIARRTAVDPPEIPGTAAPDASMTMAAPAVAAHQGDDAAVSRLWDRGHLSRFLSRAHALTGVGAAVLMVRGELGGAGAASIAATALGWALLAVGPACVWWLALDRHPGRRRSGRAWAGTWALIAGASVLAVAAGTDAQASRPRLDVVASAYQTVLVGVAAAVLVLLLVQAAGGPRGGPWPGRLYSGIFSVVGFGTAITGVAGLTVLLQRWLNVNAGGTKPTEIIQTVASVAFAAVLVVVTIAVVRWRPLAASGSERWFRDLRHMVKLARGMIGMGAALFALAAFALTIDRVWTHLLVLPVDDKGGVGWAAAGWLVVGLAAGALASSWSSAARVRWALAPALGIALLAMAVLVAGLVRAWLADTSVTAGWRWTLDTADDAFATVAIAGTLLGPLAAVGGYMFQGSKDAGARRSVGIVWDLVSFWPRAYHPWAPAPYTDTTMPQLYERVRGLLADSGARTVVLSAHSQGAIIAVPVVARLRHDGVDAHGPTRLSLLTYGQLLNVHYRWLFPWIFNPPLFDVVDEYLAEPNRGRWINLFRPTDPLGHPVGALPPERDVLVETHLTLDLGPTSKPKTLNHSNYQYAVEYQPALDALAGD